MARTVLLVAALLAAQRASAQAPPAPVVLIDTDFSRPDTARMKRVPAGDRITGMLPAGWTDDSSWARIWVTYRRMTQPQRRFLRAEVTRLDEGRAQFHHMIPDFAKPTYFRLTMTARSRTGSAIETGIRMGGSPYRFLWKTHVALPAAWRDYTFTFRLPKNPQPVGLWINQNSVGSIDLASVRLVRMTREALAAELRARYAGTAPRNLLRNTRMPLGIESGWSLDRESSDGDDVHLAPDEKVIGPSGAPALAIRSAKPMKLYTAPFAVPLAFDPHTASLYARGQATGNLLVLADNGQLARRAFKLTGKDWQRIELPFRPRLLAKSYGLRIDATGTFWIDALQVEQGSKARPYASRLACEVSLAVDSPARVQFADEPAIVRYAVTGKAAGARLRVKVVTPYGASKLLPTVTLADGFCRKGTLRYDVFGDRSLGVFRVEAEVTDAAGKPLSPPNELVVFRLRRPRYWMVDGHDSAFGTHTLSTRRHVLMAKAIGINWTRLHDAGTRYIGWYHLEPEKGRWAFRDKELKRYRRYGMKILGAFSTAPKWGSHFSHEKPHSNYFDRFYQPLDLADFATYVRTVTKRYAGGVIDTWDVWNEPWIHAWWPVDYDESVGGRAGYVTSKDAPADFARLCAVARKAARSVDPDVTVAGINSTTSGGGGKSSFSGEQWTRGVIAAGGIEACDAVVYHDYTGAVLGYPGDGCEKGFQRATGPIIAKLGRCPKPVWMTEGSSIGGIIGNGFYHHTLPQGPSENVWETSDRLSRYLVSLLSLGVRKIFLYSMHCHNYFGTGEYRVLVTPEGYLHPCGAALSTTAWLLDETKPTARLTVAKGVTAHVFEGRGRAAAVLIPMPGHDPYTPPAADGVKTLDLFGNPVPAGEKLTRYLIYLSAPAGAKNLTKLLTPS